MTNRVVVVGSLNMDLVGRVPRLPLPGETLLGSQFLQGPGGKGANQAVAAARLGAATILVGRVGTDTYGDLLVANLHTQAVDVSCIRRDGAPSGIALIMVDDAGQNAIAVLPGANANLRADDVERVALQAGDVVVAQLEVPAEPIVRAFERARAAGARTLLNAAPARPLPDGLLALTDILVVNETEASALANVSVDGVSSAARAAVRLKSSGPATVAVTLGEQGAVLASGEDRWFVHPYRVEVVDSTAAGDAWVGALAAELCAGRDLLVAAVFASAAGALTTTRKGAQAALPDRTEVERAMRHVSTICYDVITDS